MNPRTRSYYIPAPMLAELEAEARRLDRNVHWLLQRAWRLARREIRAMQGSVEPP